MNDMTPLMRLSSRPSAETLEREDIRCNGYNDKVRSKKRRTIDRSKIWTDIDQY